MDARELRRILRLGLGRAVLHLHASDAAPYRDVILDACLHCWAWESLEGTRERYMLDVVAATGDEPFYHDRVLAAVATAAPGRDGEQVVRLARLLAEDGHPRARRVLLDAYAANGAEFPDPEALFVLDGLGGLLLVADRLGSAILADEELDFWHFSPVSEAEYALGASAIWRALDHTAIDNPRVAAYASAVRADRADRADSGPRPPGPDTQTQSYDEIKTLLLGPSLKHARDPFPLERWGKGAREDDVRRAARDLLILSDDESRLLRRYVRLFMKRTFPLDPSRLIELVERGRYSPGWDRSTTPDRDVIAFDALQALEHVAHPDVRALALRLVASSTWGPRAVGLLARNYRDGDLRLVEQRYVKEQDEEDRHSIGMGVRDIYEEARPDGIADTLLLLYDRGACGLCRHAFVEALIELGEMPDWMAEECRYDSYEPTRELMVDQRRA